MHVTKKWQCVLVGDRPAHLPCRNAGAGHRHPCARHPICGGQLGEPRAGRLGPRLGGTWVTAGSLDRCVHLSLGHHLLFCHALACGMASKHDSPLSAGFVVALRRCGWTAWRSPSSPTSSRQAASCCFLQGVRFFPFSGGQVPAGHSVVQSRASMQTCCRQPCHPRNHSSAFCYQEEHVHTAHQTHAPCRRAARRWRCRLWRSRTAWSASSCRCRRVPAVALCPWASSWPERKQDGHRVGHMLLQTSAGLAAPTVLSCSVPGNLSL